MVRREKGGGGETKIAAAKTEEKRQTEVLLRKKRAGKVSESGFCWRIPARLRAADKQEPAQTNASERV